MTYQVVVVGASYGGFDALRVLLGGLPPAFPVPVVVVQHQGAGSSELASLLQRYTPLVVVEAEDKDPLRPGWVHVAPPGYHLLVDSEGLALSVDAPVVYARPSIDVLFDSAADVFGADAIGVILTGTGRDGAAGLAHIKQRGGVTIVQDPATALRRMMPDAALATSRVDWMLPLDEIAGRLVELCSDAAPAPVPGTSLTSQPPRPRDALIPRPPLPQGETGSTSEMRI
jgi:two-component system chemotaxis response regulator CheB